jgi:hypothetical protein
MALEFPKVLNLIGVNMKTTVNFSEFRDLFQQIRPDNFSYEGLKHLFSWLEQYEEDTGEELELDVIAICCEYSEQHWKDIASDYSIEFDDIETEEKQKQHIMNYLCDNTSVIGSTSDDTFIYQNF